MPRGHYPRKPRNGDPNVPLPNVVVLPKYFAAEIGLLGLNILKTADTLTEMMEWKEKYHPTASVFICIKVN